MGSRVGELLSAASLLLAVVGVFYSLWYGEITRALDITPPTHLADAAGLRRDVSRVLRARAAPLAVASLVLALVLLPEAIRLIADGIRLLWREGLREGLGAYDAVSAAFVLVVFGTGVIAVYSWSLALRLWHLKRALTPPRRT